MEFFDAVKARFSYRGPFQVQLVPREDLRRIVESGLKAPSGRNAQTTSIVVIDDSGLLDAIRALPGAGRPLREAPAVIACIIDRSPEATYEGFSFQVEDCAAVVENMLLAIAALGYASVWTDGWLRLEERAEAIGKLLGVPEDKVVRVVLPVGVPEGERRQPPKRAFEERAWFNRYGG